MSLGTATWGVTVHIGIRSRVATRIVVAGACGALAVVGVAFVQVASHPTSARCVVSHRGPTGRERPAAFPTSHIGTRVATYTSSRTRTRTAGRRRPSTRMCLRRLAPQRGSAPRRATPATCSARGRRNMLTSAPHLGRGGAVESRRSLASNDVDVGGKVTKSSGWRCDGWSDDAHGVQWVAYRGTDGHVHALRWLASTRKWTDLDLSIRSGLKVKAGSDPTLYVNDLPGGGQRPMLLVRASDRHVHQLVLSPSSGKWTNLDVSKAAHASVAPAGRPHGFTTQVPGAKAELHVLYRGSNRHVYELWNRFGTTSWHKTDLTAASHDTGLAMSDPQGLVRTDELAETFVRVQFMDQTHHLNAIDQASPGGPWQGGSLGIAVSSVGWQFSNDSASRGGTTYSPYLHGGHIFSWDVSSWTENNETLDLTGLSATSARPASSTGGYLTSPPGSTPGVTQGHLVYRTASGAVHIIDLGDQAAPSADVNVSAAAGTASKAVGSPTGYASAVTVPQNHIDYRSADGHVHELWRSSVGGWHHTDLSAAARSSVKAASDPVGWSDATSREQVVAFVGTDRRLHLLTWRAATRGWADVDLTAITGVTGKGQPSYFLNDLSPTRSENLVYAGTDNHLHDASRNLLTGAWSDTDLTNVTHDSAVPVGRTFGMTSPGSVEADLSTASESEVHLFFRGTDGHIHEYWRHWTSSPWAATDLNQAANGGQPAARDPEAWFDSTPEGWSLRVGFVQTNGGGGSFKSSLAAPDTTWPPDLGEVTACAEPSTRPPPCMEFAHASEPRRSARCVRVGGHRQSLPAERVSLAVCGQLHV